MIIEYNKKYLSGYTRLIKLLWNSIEDKDINEIILEHELNKDKIFIAMLDEEVIGFINVSLRNDYVEGCSTKGVGYIEGIYVCETHRRNKVAYELVNHAIDFFKSMGISEIGSDTDISNEMSQFFHKAIGFKEVERNVHYIMKIGD